MSIVKRTKLEEVILEIDNKPLYVLCQKTFRELGPIVAIKFGESSNKLFSNVVAILWKELNITEETDIISITKEKFQEIISTFDNIFICPDCGSMGLDRALGDALLATPVCKAVEGGNFPELDESIVLEGTFDFFQCKDCNFTLDCAEDELYSCLVEMNKKRLAKK